MKNKYFLLGALLTAAAAVLGSCSSEDAAAFSRMIGGASTALVYQDCRAVSEDEIEFTFSQPVTVKEITLDPKLDVASIENGSTVRVKLAETQTPGKLITADLVAEDEKKNSINVLVSLRARNNRMPALVINEINTENGSNAAGKKPEFIELKTKSAGNLGAMRLCIVGNTNASMKTIYEFSPVEVESEKYLVVHLRTLEPENKDELGSDLAESKGVNASPNARDFWIPGNTKLIHKQASIVYVLDQDDEVLSAVMISEKPDLPWTKDYFIETSQFLVEKGAWIEGPISSAGTTNTRTICRDETAANTNSAADWYITYTSSATPGSGNNPKRWTN